jgi:transcriptional regulator GlxA family with amidase domain
MQIRTTVLQPHQHQRSSLAITLDMLETANRVARLTGHDTRFDTRVRPVTGEAGAPSDLVILPGLGLGTAGEVRQYFDSAEGRALTHLLPQLARSPGTVIATSCSGVFAFGLAGLLQDRDATTTWWLLPTLAELCPRARLNMEKTIVDAGPVITAGAAFAQIDLMLHLIERFAGFALAEDCRRFTMSDSRPSQLPYQSVATLVATDPVLQRAEIFARRNLDQPVTVQDLSQASGLAPRTFARRMQKVAAMTPSVFLQTLRVTEAIRLARTSQLSSEQIACRVGYADATALRRTMRRRVGRSLESFRPSRLQDA